MTGPMGSGLPQFGLPRRLAILDSALPLDRRVLTTYDLPLDSQNAPLVSILNGKLTRIEITLRIKAH